MHKTTKLTPVMRREVFDRWKKGVASLRELGREYHVDKKVVQRIVERGKKKDFSVHSSVNARYLPKPTKKKAAAKKKKKK